MTPKPFQCSLWLTLFTILVTSVTHAQKFYSSLSWSPDGSKLLVGQEVWEGDKGKYSQLMMNIDGSSMKIIAEGAGGGTWAPDGKTIVWEKNRVLFRSNPDGSNAKQITSDGAESLEPSFSPDGKSIAYTTIEDKKGNILIMNADGTGSRKVAQGYTSQWAPSGNVIVFYKDRGDNMDKVYTLDLKSGTERLLTNDSLHNYYPSWTLDGKIIFSSTDRLHKDRENVAGLYRMAADGTSKEKVGDIVPWLARMSPDGKHIAFTRPNPNWNGSHVYIYDLNSGQEKKITN